MKKSVKGLLLLLVLGLILVALAACPTGDSGSVRVLKPVIYLYPQEATVCSVGIELDGELTCTYPQYGGRGWENFVALPDGTLNFPDGGEYYCLYWEGDQKITPDFSKGFCVKGSDTAHFLNEMLLAQGLTPREANEFIIYWLPLMQNNAYNLISFQTKAYTEGAKLTVEPSPDTLIRVFMAWKALEEAVEVEPQEFTLPQRTGFVAVEWGGAEIIN